MSILARERSLDFLLNFAFKSAREKEREKERVVHKLLNPFSKSLLRHKF